MYFIQKDTTELNAAPKEMFTSTALTPDTGVIPLQSGQGRQAAPTARRVDQPQRSPAVPGAFLAGASLPWLQTTDVGVRARQGLGSCWLLW